MWARCHPFPPQQNPFAFSDMHKKVNLPQRVRPACLSAVGPSDRLLVIPASCMIPSLIFASNHGRVRAEPACLPACLPWAHCGERLVKTYYASRLVSCCSCSSLSLPLSLSPSLPPLLFPLRCDDERGRHQLFAQHNNATHEKSASSAY